MTVHTRRIEEHVVEGKPLGRHVVHDPRSKKPEFAAQQATKIVDTAHLSVGLPLNQKAVGKCTCEATAGALNSKPNHVDGAHVFTDKDTDSMYELETKLEGHPWTPGDETNDIGGSGLMVCKAAKQMGLIRSYHHAFGLQAALKALVLRPVIFGFDWYEGFDSPDSKGLVKIAGQVRGGHEICALQIIAVEKLVGFAQSWDKWGVANKALGLKTGAFFMSFDTVDELLSSEGDATVPMV